jgi:hypothetical protein
MAILTVDSGGGGDYTTMAAAVAAATGGVDSIQIINNDLNESTNLGKHIVEVFADVPTRVWTGSGLAGLFQIVTGMDGQLVFRDFTMRAGGDRGPCVKWNAFDTGGKVVFRDMKIDFSDHGTSGPDRRIFWVNVTLPAVTDSLVFERCEVIGHASNTTQGIYLGATTHGADSVRIENCTIRDVLNGGTANAIEYGNSTTNLVHNIYNNTIENCGIGIGTSGRGTIKNNLFINNTDDVSLAGSAIAGDYTYNAFEEQGSPFGTNNIFSITSTNEVVDETNHDFHLKKAAQSRNAGEAAVTSDDFDGDPRPSSGSLDIGAYEFQQLGMNNGEAWLAQNADGPTLAMRRGI